MTEKQIKRRLARIRNVAALLAALNSAAHEQNGTRGGNMETVIDCLFDLLRPLLEAEHRWNRDTCDVAHDLDIALIDLEQTIGQGH